MRITAKQKHSVYKAALYVQWWQSRNVCVYLCIYIGFRIFGTMRYVLEDLVDNFAYMVFFHYPYYINHWYPLNLVIWPDDFLNLIKIWNSFVWHLIVLLHLDKLMLSGKTSIDKRAADIFNWLVSYRSRSALNELLLFLISL